MIFQNKISSKNAFDLDTDYVSKISDLIADRVDSELSWLRASASLDASAKIYSYRVD